MAKKKVHGGKRAGAGRKPSNPEGVTKLVTATVPIELMEKLDEMADKRDWNRSQAITEAIRGLVQSQ